MKIFKKIKKNNRGFVILFAITIGSILLAIALGVANIALKEVKFSTSAKDTNNAFFAADTGAECALFNEKSSVNAFRKSGGPSSITCVGSSISFSFDSDPTAGIWNFTIPDLGSEGNSCASVSVIKDFSASPITTKIVSKGYNDGGSACVSGPNTVERELLLNLNY